MYLQRQRNEVIIVVRRVKTSKWQCTDVCCAVSGSSGKSTLRITNFVASRLAFSLIRYNNGIQKQSNFGLFSDDSNAEWYRSRHFIWLLEIARAQMFNYIISVYHIIHCIAHQWCWLILIFVLSNEEQFKDQKFHFTLVSRRFFWFFQCIFLNCYSQKANNLFVGSFKDFFYSGINIFQAIYSTITGSIRAHILFW